MTAPTTSATPKIALDQRAPSRHDKAYADIRGVIETARRQSIGTLQAIRNVLAAPIDAILVDTG